MVDRPLRTMLQPNWCHRICGQQTWSRTRILSREPSRAMLNGNDRLGRRSFSNEPPFFSYPRIKEHLMQNLNKDAFLFNELCLKIKTEKLSQKERQRLKEIKSKFSESRTLSDWDLSELRQFRADSNRNDARWLHQDIEARFNAVFNPARPK